MKRSFKALVATAALSVAYAAPDADFAVPVIGYVYDAAPGQVRPLTGTPGAATVGAGLAIGAFEKALLAGDGSFALVSSTEAESLQLLRLSSSGMEVSGIVNAAAAFDKGSLSPGSASALLYSAACDCVSVVGDLRNEPKLLRSLALPHGADVRALALDDKASVAAVAIRIDGDSKVLLYTGETETPTAELGLWADALAFDGAGQRLLVVETAARKLHVVSNLGESPALMEVLSERDGLKSPSAAAFGPDATVLIADADSGIFVWNETDRSSRVIECLCRPSAIERTATAGLYRISSLDGKTVWVLEASAETPRTFFVPVQRAEVAK